MALGNRQIKTYLSINQGKVEHSENGVKNYYGYVDGRLLSIYSKQREYNGEKVDKWFIEMVDEEGILYCISFPFSSGAFKSIILSLASYEQLTLSTKVKIEPYLKGNFTNVVVTADGVKLDWVTKELPPVETVKIGGKEIKDDSKRMEYISTLVGIISNRLENNNTK